MKRLDNKISLITGGTSGIGKVIVEQFAKEGSHVVFCGRREDLGEKVESEVRSHGGEIMFIRCDVTDSNQLSALVDRTIEAHGRLDIVVNNAGGTTVHQWPDDSEDNWDQTIDLNLNSMYHLCRHCWPHLMANGGGSIVVITSLSAIGGIGKTQLELMGGRQPSPAYQASKSGMEGLVIHLAGRGGEYGIRVNAVRPGRILTKEWEDMLGEEGIFWGMYKEIQMLKRHGRSIDVANAALYLASDESSFVTAEIIDVNGGAIAKV